MNTEPHSTMSRQREAIARWRSRRDARARKFPTVWYYAVLLGWVVVLILIAVQWGAATASIALAMTMVVLAVLRIILPDGYIPRIRRRSLDATMYLGFAVILLILAHWGNTPHI
ncbi:DUF3017 domain-containing protein [Trueperella sp. LYQ143]|uniref:DUF3017 domain-containing protein n=1 Tax=unclassified Trueperella TaxID=2630174 RepID=UPI0039830F08